MKNFVWVKFYYLLIATNEGETISRSTKRSKEHLLFLSYAQSKIACTSISIDLYHRKIRKLANE